MFDYRIEKAITIRLQNENYFRDLLQTRENIRRLALEQMMSSVFDSRIKEDLGGRLQNREKILDLRKDNKRRTLYKKQNREATMGYFQ